MKMHIKEEPPPKKETTQSPQLPVKESVKEGSSEGDLSIDPTHSTSSIGSSNHNFIHFILLYLITFYLLYFK